jgi:hypothetical protein
MTERINSSNEFMSLLQRLHQSPEDPALKRLVLQHLPEIQTMAKGNPLAMYHLAQIYPHKSTQYLQMIRQSANLGCTNAMLDLCASLLQSGSPAALNTAAHYMKLIQGSKDSYIIKLGADLLHDNPNLAAAMKTQSKPSQGPGFFAHKPKQEHKRPVVERDLSLNPKKA